MKGEFLLRSRYTKKPNLVIPEMMQFKITRRWWEVLKKKKKRIGGRKEERRVIKVT